VWNGVVAPKDTQPAQQRIHHEFEVKVQLLPSHSSYAGMSWSRSRAALVYLTATADSEGSLHCRAARRQILWRKILLREELS
jgi:hypothetical protein